MAIDSKYGKITAEHGDRAHGANPSVPLNESGDEPVFVIRAQDASSVEAVKAYFVVAAQAGAEFDYHTIVGTVDRFVEWQVEHPELVKVPD